MVSWLVWIKLLSLSALTNISGLVFWGAAIVIFLVKIINFHNANTQGFWVEISSQVETGKLSLYLPMRCSSCTIAKGLFTLTSIGLIPSRALDTYRQ